jgi:dolichol-phosphate mannosyltransferase
MARVYSRAVEPEQDIPARVERPRYSIVVPVYNEEDAVPELGKRLVAVLDRLDGPSEVILVDDGSTDRSLETILDLARRDLRFRGVQLSRNFGHQVAITAGIDLAAGDAVVIMDADLQHPPEVIEDLVERWRQGYEVVYAVRADRAGEPRLKRTTARIFYRALGRLTEIDVPADAGDFRLVDRRALDAFRGLRETNRYVRGMFSWIGFRQTGVPYRYEARVGGTTKYTLRRMSQLAGNALTSFSSAPLRLALHLGFVVATLSILAAAAAVIANLAGAFTVPGWTSLVFVTSFLGGVQLFILGVVGVYLGRVYEEVKGRPLYIVRELYGFENTPQGRARGVLAGRGPASADGP